MAKTPKEPTIGPVEIYMYCSQFKQITDIAIDDCTTLFKIRDLELHYARNRTPYADLNDRDAMEVYFAAEEKRNEELRELSRKSKAAIFQFACAIGCVARYIRNSQHITLLEEISKNLDKLEYILTVAQPWRDMIEHSDEYELGIGRFQDKHMQRHDTESGLDVHSDPWGLTITDNDEFVIGSRIHPSIVIHELNILKGYLDKVKAPVPGAMDFPRT